MGPKPSYFNSFDVLNEEQDILRKKAKEERRLQKRAEKKQKEAEAAALLEQERKEKLAALQCVIEKKLAVAWADIPDDDDDFFEDFEVAPVPKVNYKFDHLRLLKNQPVDSFLDPHEREAAKDAEEEDEDEDDDEDDLEAEDDENDEFVDEEDSPAGNEGSGVLLSPLNDKKLSSKMSSSRANVSGISGAGASKNAEALKLKKKSKPVSDANLSKKELRDLRQKELDALESVFSEFGINEAEPNGRKTESTISEPNDNLLDEALPQEKEAQLGSAAGVKDGSALSKKKKKKQPTEKALSATADDPSGLEAAEEERKPQNPPAAPLTREELLKKIASKKTKKKDDNLEEAKKLAAEAAKKKKAVQKKEKKDKFLFPKLTK